MKISLIIPVYNGEKYYDYFRRNIREIYNDDRFEIIIVDDGSSDNFIDTVKKHFPKIICIIQANQGAGVARNTGVENATGDWVMFMDVDDKFNNDALEKILSKPEALVDVNCFMAKRVFYKQDKGDRVWKPEVFKKEFSGSAELRADIIVDSIVMNKIFRRSFLVDSGVTFPSGKYEDKIFLTNLYLKKPKISIRPIYLYQWFVFPNSKSQTNVKNLDDVNQRFDICTEQLEMTHGTRFFDVVLANTFTHDFVLYSQNFRALSPEMKQELFLRLHYFRKFEKPPGISRRGNVVYYSKTFEEFKKNMSRLDNSRLINRIRNILRLPL